MRQKQESDAMAAEGGLGRRVEYHRVYRMPPLAITYFSLTVALTLALISTQGLWLLLAIPVAILGAIAAYALWPIDEGLRGVGVYDSGLVILAVLQSQSVALPWTAISRVDFRKHRSRTAYSGLGSRTVHVEYAFTRIWLRGMTDSVAVMHVWRHKRLVRTIQATIKSVPAAGTAQ